MMLLPAMAFGSADKKDDKKGGKDTKEEKPATIVTWDFDWVPIFRAAEE